MLDSSIGIASPVPFQIDTRVAPVVGRNGPSKKKKKRKKAPLATPDVTMGTSAEKKQGVYDIWGSKSNNLSDSK